MGDGRAVLEKVATGKLQSLTRAMAAEPLDRQSVKPDASRRRWTLP
jgi:hypothetical protein